METQLCDLLILGGGPAGMTAAIYAARANLSVVIIDVNACGGLINWTKVVENMPSYQHIGGMELAERMQEQTVALGVRIEEVAIIETIDLTGDRKVIETDECRYEAPAIILATGRKPLALEATGDCENVHYCAICDGNAYVGKRVLVVGGGNSGFDEAIALLDQGISHVTLVEKMDQFFAAQAAQKALFSRSEAVAYCHTEVESLEMDEGKLVRVVLKNTQTDESQTIPCDGIFVFMGQTPNTQPFQGILDLDESGYIRTNAQMGTSLSGVYAAGDACAKKYRQITTAMADGTIAALEAERYIRQTSR